MSLDDRPEFQALAELEHVLDNLKAGVSDWRRRALRAEAQHADVQVGSDVVTLREKVLALDAENSELNRRLEAARSRLEGLLGRLRFLEEQVVLEEQRT